MNKYLLVLALLAGCATEPNKCPAPAPRLTCPVCPVCDVQEAGVPAYSPPPRQKKCHMETDVKMSMDFSGHFRPVLVRNQHCE